MIAVVTKCRLGVLVSVALLLISASAAPQPPVADELRLLERYLGSWTYDGEDKTPGTGGKVTCTATRRQHLPSIVDGRQCSDVDRHGGEPRQSLH